MNFCYELVLLCHRWQFCSKLFNTLSHRWLVFDVGCHHWLFYFVDRYRHLLFSTLGTTMWIQYLLTSPSGEKEEKKIASYTSCVVIESAYKRVVMAAGCYCLHSGLSINMESVYYPHSKVSVRP